MRNPVRAVRDLLFHFPRDYRDYSRVLRISSLRPGQEATVVAEVWSVGSGAIGRRRGTEAIVNDGTGAMRVIWWGQVHIARQLKQGMRLALSGRVSAFGGRVQMENPEFEPLDDESLNTRRLVPVYTRPETLTQRTVRAAARAAVEAFADSMPETLPQDQRARLKLLPVADALRQAHLPDSLERAAAAIRRFAFEELLEIELGVVKRRREWQQAGKAPGLALPPAVLDAFVRSLPFDLTSDQRAAIDDVLRDTSRDVPMARLLEGDVGTGKTAVAAAALLAAVTSGFQGAIMAPTEILAEQLYRTVCRLIDRHHQGFSEEPLSALNPPYLGREIRVGLLRGSQKAAVKGAVQRAIRSGDVDIVAGTHALIQRQVEFPRLGLVLVDEQHRFGVAQRAALRAKGGSPHTLVLTATPIPRTLALTVYGDLDITVMRQMPEDRPSVKTFLVRAGRAQEVHEFLRRKVRDGTQAYVICPLVEESESIQAKAAVQEYERLSREVFPDLRLGLLHGRMAAPEKDAVMRHFRDHGLDMLVSTAVVEVGVDVPNATVIVIEGADRFGLSQLHQFRGRVRRSREQAYCFLLASSDSEEAVRRLRYLETKRDGSQLDGLQLAEVDLELRGPGEYFGTRQSGMPDLRVARLTDVELISIAREEASRLLDTDPDLARPEHAPLRASVQRVWGRLTAEVS
jgi:ATP-dependent DNA helicase RecG